MPGFGLLAALPPPPRFMRPAKKEARASFWALPSGEEPVLGVSGSGVWWVWRSCFERLIRLNLFFVWNWRGRGSASINQIYLQPLKHVVCVDLDASHVELDGADVLVDSPFVTNCSFFSGLRL